MCCSPGIIYYGNPSGEKSEWVPVFKAGDGEQAIFEEHRYPMPFACGQWQQGGQWYGAARFKELGVNIDK